jgi:hypothetical protein
MLVEHQALGLALWALCWYPMARYFARREWALPAFELICIAYGVQFGLAAFISQPYLRLAIGETYINPGDKTAVQLLSLLGAAAIQVGYYATMRMNAQHSLPKLRMWLSPQRGLVYAVVMGIIGLGLMYAPSLGLFSMEDLGGGQAFVALLRNQVNIAIVILAWLVYKVRRRRALMALLMYGLTAAATVAGVYQGTLETVLIPLVVLLTARWLFLRRIPWAACVFCLLLFLFLQPVKGSYRDVTWYQSPGEGGVAENVQLWASLGVDYWSGVINGEGATLDDGVRTSFARTDYIHLFAHTYSMTPSKVPYQQGDTYKYLVIALIPRMLWPDKPIAQQANDFFALSYGISSDEQIGLTMAGISVLIESFVNFGIPGVAAIMFLQGVIFSVLNVVLNSKDSGVGCWAIYLSLAVYFLNGIGSNTAALYGGMIQVIAVNYFLMLWARKRAAAPSQ